MSEISSGAMTVCIRGGGDVGSGVARRLHLAGYRVLVLEKPAPLAVRRAVSFSSALPAGECHVEKVKGVAVTAPAPVPGAVAVFADPAGSALRALRPDVLVDARMLKIRPADTRRGQAPLVIGLGPGFEAGDNCDAVIETLRGPSLGAVMWKGSAAPDTGVPAERGGASVERVLRAPAAGPFKARIAIGARVQAGDTVGDVAGQPVVTRIAGVLRGLLASGVTVHAGDKLGDVDPLCTPEDCLRVSDRSDALGRSVLKAIRTHYERSRS